MFGNEDNEFINTLRKEFGDKTNKIIQPERSFEDTVSQILFDKGYIPLMNTIIGIKKKEMNILTL